MKLEKQITKTVNGLLDLIYPPGLYCISCGKITDNSRTYRLCNKCMEAINWNTGRSCDKCGRPLSDNDPGELCFGCARKERSGEPFSFNKGHACTGYGAAMQSVIFALKYGGRSDIGETLGGIMFDYMNAFYTTMRLSDMYDMVIPVPIHKERKGKRGFNHAEIMAQSFARRAGIRCESYMVRRTRSTKPMKGLRPSERRVNIEGAFEVIAYRRSELAGARVLLVDDIFTTGATIDEIASLLKTEGVSRVDSIACAAAADILSS